MYRRGVRATVRTCSVRLRRRFARDCEFLERRGARSAPLTPQPSEWVPLTRRRRTWKCASSLTSPVLPSGVRNPRWVLPPAKHRGTHPAQTQTPPSRLWIHPGGVSYVDKASVYVAHRETTTLTRIVATLLLSSEYRKRWPYHRRWSSTFYSTKIF